MEVRILTLSKATSPYINRQAARRPNPPWPLWYAPPIMPSGKMKQTNAQELIKSACLFTGVTPSEFRSGQRYKSMVWARHAVVYVLHRYRPDMSYPQIARATGRKCHSTIINSHKKAIKLRQDEPEFAALVTRLESTVNGTD